MRKSLNRTFARTLNFGHGHRGRIFHTIRPLLHSTFTAAPIPRRLGPDSSEIASKWAGHASIQGLAVLIVERLGRPHARRALTSTHAVEAIADLILTGADPQRRTLIHAKFLQ